MAIGAARRHLWTVQRLPALCLVAALLTGCAHPAPLPPPVRVLFVGNSYTYVNDLPQLFAALAAAGKHPAEVAMTAPGGWTLMEHARSPDTRKKIDASPWNFVVLQEQSIVPSVVAARETGMYPAVRQLATLIRAHGSEPVLYLTWGRRDGLRENGFADYQAMQTALTDGYLRIADQLDLRVAPAGAAWQVAADQYPGTPLWDGDGSHPALAGSYLTACVLYVTLFRASPEGLPVPQGIDRALGERLQALAATVVLKDAARWHLH
jgi:hypothetical protein